MDKFVVKLGEFYIHECDAVRRIRGGELGDAVVEMSLDGSFAAEFGDRERANSFARSLTPHTDLATVSVAKRGVSETVVDEMCGMDKSYD